jgi:hypothetical protein
MELTLEEKVCFDEALIDIGVTAEQHCRRRPAMSTLIEEVAEAILAARGKHDHDLALEISQIGGICVNILWQLYMDQHEHVQNIGGSVADERQPEQRG